MSASRYGCTRLPCCTSSSSDASSSSHPSGFCHTLAAARRNLCERRPWRLPLASAELQGHAWQQLASRCLHAVQGPVGSGKLSRHVKREAATGARHVAGVGAGEGCCTPAGCARHRREHRRDPRGAVRHLHAVPAGLVRCAVADHHTTIGHHKASERRRRQQHGPQLPHQLQLALQVCERAPCARRLCSNRRLMERLPT